MTAASGEGDRTVSAWQGTDEKMTAASKEILQFLDSLPRTPSNTTLINSVRQSIGEIKTQLADNIQQAQRARRPNADGTAMVTVGDIHRRVDQMQGMWTGFHTLYCDLFPGQVRFVRDFAVNYRRLLGADLIGAR